ncbi:putative glutaredoxin, Thioredoxin-like superfamily [Dioscorea sansibarensis]
MAAVMKLSHSPAFFPFPCPKPSSKLLSTTLSFGLYSSSFSSPPSLISRRPPTSFNRRKRALLVVSAIGKLSETELISIPTGSDGLGSIIPSAPGIYGVYDKNGDLQFIGVTRNVAASIATHCKSVPDLCSSVKVGLVEEASADRETLTNAWKSWMEEHITATGKIPPGNETGNQTFVRRPTQKPDIQLTPGRHVQLTVPLEELIDRLVKDKEVVAFIKGSRNAPQCGFSQRVVGILQSHGVDFESVDVLDEEHNYGLRETLKTYSNWPTFPQVFVKGEFVGGCDIISSMAEKGELASLFQK